MFSRVSPRGAVFEVPHDSADGGPLPPPPPRNASNGPDSRSHVRRPPTLNTNSPAHLSGPVHHLTTPTPSSLSSPFAFSAAAHATSAVSATGPASRGVSPENHRLSGNFTNMAYNPQEWTSGRQSVETRQRRDVYGEPLDTPPPPYPEQRNSTAAAFTNATITYSSPAGSLSSSPVAQHATITTDPINYNQASRSNTTHQTYESRRHTRMANVPGPEYIPARVPIYPQFQAQQPNIGSSSSLSYQTGHTHHVDSSQLLPPPPPRRTTPNLEPDPPSRPPFNTRRSTSAGPTPTGGPSVPRGARTFSTGPYQEHSTWSSTMQLPGPPPLPPPSSRSRSAGPDPELEHGGSYRRPPRLQIRHSNLTPIPATPSSIASGVSARANFPLRIDTANTSVHGKAPAMAPVEDNDEGQASRVGPAALARRSAVRGPAARSSTNPGIRSRSKSITRRAEPMDAPPSTTLSANPWASALEQARSPGPETLPDPAGLPFSSLNSLVVTSNLAQSQTPPVTPGVVPKEIHVGQDQHVQQAKVLPTPPLSQKPLLSANSVTTGAINQNDLGQEEDAFIAQAMKRNADFLRKEAEAETDLERLQLFMSYVQQESLLRKERYADAFGSDGFDLDGAKAMLFNVFKGRRASERELTVNTNVDQSPTAAGTGSNRPESTWWKDYRPALSPIASMDYDEQSSRGRAPSRWWESAPGSQSDGQSQGFARSKRESKYMSLSKQLLHSMENEMQPVYEESAWPSQYPNEKANPETFGFYDEELVSPPLTAKARQTPKPSALDISRFITLPPPYPRHFPAVNNSHPDLTEYRTTVRMLSDLGDAKNRQSRHKASVEAMRSERQNRVSENRKAFRSDIQTQIAEGSISYAEAADAEKQLKSQEHEIERQGLQTEFESLQDVVINPLHDQLNERIMQLGNSLESLQRELFANAANQDPDQPVQEGDDVPELLEQLTQLKWIFDAREVLHQELFNLLTQRNDAYKAIVALPYHQCNNLDKVRDTDAFFDKDAATRHTTFCADALSRHESFLNFIDENALRGIEMQSSAFWDITPGLVDLLHKIPSDLNKLDIHIPDEELSENPTYQQHPQQYLYLLLQHAERSSYQYIEGQVNLYCLVHEVKTSSLSAHYRASKAQQKMAGDQSIDLADTRSEDEGELTEELKNRATMIEDQWQDALGRQLSVVKDRVKKQLQKRGAWDDIAADTEG